MLVTLIGKNVLYKLKLPTKKTGNYWITDDDGKKLINIVETQTHGCSRRSVSKI